MADTNGTNGRIAGDPGFGPPKGSTSDYAGAPSIPLRNLVAQSDRMLGGTTIPVNDPGYLPPYDPLTGGDETKSRAGLIYRDIPLVTIQNAWSVDAARGALYAHMQGRFDQSAQLWDSILGDDRVASCIASRTTGLFSREAEHLPADDSDAAKECRDAWAKYAWPILSGGSAFPELLTYQIGMGQSYAQVVWDTTRPVWCPILRPWHNRYTYWHWTLRKMIALSLDGQIAINPGDGKWFALAPFGEYRGWIRGAIRPTTEPWLLRHFAFRDMANFSEIHGMPIRKASTPMAADPGERAQFVENVARLGSNTTLLIGKGVDQHNSYDFDLVEAGDTAWEVFPSLIDRCDMSIVLAINMQNLTTEVKGGSFAATTSHMDVRQGGIQFDGTALTFALQQLARPFAYFNFGDADLAPITKYDVEPRENYELQAKQFQQFGTAVEVLRRGGVEFKDVEELRKFASRKFGLDGLPDFAITAPVAGGGAK